MPFLASTLLPPAWQALLPPAAVCWPAAGLPSSLGMALQDDDVVAVVASVQAGALLGAL